MKEGEGMKEGREGRGMRDSLRLTFVETGVRPHTVEEEDTVAEEEVEDTVGRC